MEDKKLMFQIGENIYKYRTEQGLTQAQLAEKVGISIAFLSRIECGKKSMKIATLCSFADALSVSCDALIYPSTSDSRIDTIIRLLQPHSESYLAGVEELLRILEKQFPETQPPTSDPD